MKGSHPVNLGSFGRKTTGGNSSGPSPRGFLSTIVSNSLIRYQRPKCKILKVFYFPTGLNAPPAAFPGPGFFARMVAAAEPRDYPKKTGSETSMTRNLRNCPSIGLRPAGIIVRGSGKNSEMISDISEQADLWEY
jgi:hypothetical protein